MKNEYIISKADISDALGIARVQVKIWQSTYRGQIDDDHLNQLDIGKRKEKWDTIISDPKIFVYIAKVNDSVVGFVCANMFAEREGYQGEITSIYVLEEFQGNGIGKELFQTMCHNFQKHQITHFHLWVLETNAPSRKFYEALGGKSVDKKVIQIGGKEVSEIMYGFLLVSK